MSNTIIASFQRSGPLHPRACVTQAQRSVFGKEDDGCYTISVTKVVSSLGGTRNGCTVINLPYRVRTVQGCTRERGQFSSGVFACVTVCYDVGGACLSLSCALHECGVGRGSVGFFYCHSSNYVKCVGVRSGCGCIVGRDFRGCFVPVRNFFGVSHYGLYISRAKRLTSIYINSMGRSSSCARAVNRDSFVIHGGGVRGVVGRTITTK